MLTSEVETLLTLGALDLQGKEDQPHGVACAELQTSSENTYTNSLFPETSLTTSNIR